MAKPTRVSRKAAAERLPFPARVAPPNRRTKTVRRQRLLSLLREGLERRATVVSAPAGFGKTSLLLDFAQDAGRPICWYSLDEPDRDLKTFLSYLVASLQSRFPRFGKRVAALANGSGEPDVGEAVELLVGETFDVNEPFIVVLDDVHHLDAQCPSHDLLAGWLYRLPDNCHLVLAGRTRPALSVLPLLAARQEVATIGPADFAFAPEEVGELFADVFGQHLSADEARELAEASEGWAAALVLLAPGREKGLAALRQERLKPTNTLYQYFELEILAALPPELRDTVLACAVPRDVDAELLADLVEPSALEEALAALERWSLLRVGDGDRPRLLTWLRSFLVSKLRGERPAQFEALNLKAAAWHEQRGRPEEAVYHYVQAQAWDRVVGITDRAGRGLFEEGRWDTLAGWLDSIPAEQLAAQPRLVLWKAKVLHYLNQLDQALQLLAAPVRSFEAAGDWSSLAEALITKGMCLRLKGDYPAAKEALSRARSLLLEYDGPMSALTEARKELGITYGACGEFDLAAQELKGVLDIYEAQGDSYNIAHVSDQLGTSLLFAGELAKAAGYLERAVARWKKLGNEARLLQTLNNLGLLYYMQGLWPEAEAMFREAAERAASTGARYVHAYATASLADVERDRGNLDEAVRLYQQSLDLAHELDERFLRVYDLSALADAFRMKGERAAALSLVDQAVSEAREHGGVYEMGLCQTALGLIYREDGRLKEAVDCLEDAVALLKQGDAKRDLARACFHLADAYFGLKRKRIALDCLETAARVVQELGYDHFLAVEAARTPLLVQYAAANKAADGYYGRLLKQVKAGGAQTEAAPEDAGDGRLPAIEAYGFGNVRVVVAGREVSDLEWRSEKSKEMFFFFLANRRPLRKEEVIAALWPDLPDDKTTSSFHSTLYRLRQALHPECIAKDSGCYLLNPLASIRFDVEELQSAVKEAEGGEPGDGELERLEKAVALYRGGFGQDFYTEWAESLRWQLEEQYLRLLATLASAYSRRGDHKRSASLCQQVLAVDEYNEAAWYRLMRSYLAAGEVEAAKFAYRRYSELLREGMGDEPSPEFEELRALMAKEPGA